MTVFYSNPGHLKHSQLANTSCHIHLWLATQDASITNELINPLQQFGYTVIVYIPTTIPNIDTNFVPPDILVIDLELLNTDSTSITNTEYFSQFSALQNLECPILIAASEDNFQSRRRAAQIKAIGFLLKPLDAAQLVDNIERILGEHYAPPLRVLIIDNDLELANHFCKVLRTEGIETALLTDPSLIIDTIDTFRPEFILLDMEIPGYSAPELAAIIRYHNDLMGIPIVFLYNADALNPYIEEMQQIAADFIRKPIKDSHLVTAIKMRAVRFRQLAKLMSKDSLTGLLKHTRIKEGINLELVRVQRSDKTLSIAMLDIDHFRQVNKDYGHAAGDRVIVALGYMLKHCLRKGDGIGRYGGEEFVAILPECDPNMAYQVMDNIRERFAGLQFQHEGQKFFCTISIGIAYTNDLAVQNSDSLLIATEEALQLAKQWGRNQVRLATHATRNSN